MPWEESCAMDERVRFISDYLRRELSMTELCERHQISRKTGYKWLWRYAEFGAAGLHERSRAPLVHGGATAPEIVAEIVEMREAHKSWGSRKIIAKLADQKPEVTWPSPSTATEILKRAGKVEGRSFRRHPPPRSGELTQPQHTNHVWGVDHKGWVRLGDGSRVEPLTITDAFSRYLIRVAATSSVAHAEAKPVFERAFREYGLPEVIRSDNGAPFASSGTTGLTALSAWWIKLGIKHERIDPGRPQQNGRQERFHLTLLEAMRPAERNLAAQARRFQAFTGDYNEERPHEALGQRPPASVYRRSPRKMPSRLPEPDYPAEAAIRKVRSNGEIKWQGELVHICSALIGEAVAVEETETGHWQVRFFNVPLGWIDPDTKKLRRFAVPVHGDGKAKTGTKT
jgi:transposase InsO family protein